MIYILFIIGFGLLVKGADMLIKGASNIAKRFNISDFFVGLTVVALGTSLPELFVNIQASIQGADGLAIGNVIGSNITNILLVFGVIAIIKKFTIEKAIIKKDLPISILITFIAYIFINDGIFPNIGSGLQGYEGLVLLIIFIVFILWRYIQSKEDEVIEIEKESMPKAFLYIVIGIIGLIFGAKWVVGGAEAISTFFGIKDSIIGLTIIALGTSLPELVVSVIAIKKSKSNLALGNIIGSNIANISFILGASSLIRTVNIDSLKTNINIIFLMIISIVIYIYLRKNKYSLGRKEGIVMLVLYIVCLLYIFLGK